MRNYPKIVFYCLSCTIICQNGAFCLYRSASHSIISSFGSFTHTKLSYRLSLLTCFILHFQVSYFSIQFQPLRVIFMLAMIFFSFRGYSCFFGDRQPCMLDQCSFVFQHPVRVAFILFISHFFQSEFSNSQCFYLFQGLTF